MRILFCFLFFTFCFSTLAQETNEVVNPNTNRLVKFYPDNQPYVGITNYPQRIEDTDLLTTPAGWNTNFIGRVGFEEHMAGFGAVLSLARSNKVYLARIQSANNLARLLQLYDLIPAGRVICTNNAATIATIEASLASGTNTQAQVIVRIRQLNGVVAEQRVIHANVLEYLQRLGPMLRDLYRADRDTSP